MAPFALSARRRLAAEDGVSLIEVMVSAALLLMVGVAVLNGIDTATGVSGTARAKAVAGNVAQTDQERLRTLKARQLSNLFEVTTAEVSGIAFTTTSRADWVSDATQTTSCENGGASSDYLKLTTVTTWNGANNPVRLESIMAPPNGSFGPTEGSVGVQIDDRSDPPQGQPGIEVDIVGPPSFDKDTDAQGCAFFGFLPSGNQYKAVVDAPGYVDPDGKQRIERQVSVVPEGISSVGLRYDRAARVDAQFETKVGGVLRPARSDSLALANAGLTAGQRVVSSTSGLQGSMSADSLFPFLTPYTAYAGNCPSAQPPDAFLSAHQATLDPGEQVALKVRMPALSLTLTGTYRGNQEVRFKPQGAGCSTVVKRTNSSGVIDAPELPYGVYDLCVPIGSSNRVLLPSVTNTNPDGGARTLSTDSGQSGTC